MSETQLIMCHCGQPLHYSNAVSRALIESVIAAQGEFVTITVAGRSWAVQRHYIALHGIIAAELPNLGFEEIRT